MAITGSFGFTNTTDSTVDLTPTKLGWSNYTKSTNSTPGKVIMQNITCPIDQAETVTFMTQDLKNISHEVPTTYPPERTDSRLITVKVEAKERLTSSVDETYIVDLPYSCNVSFRFMKSSYVTDAKLMTLLKRTVGALQDENSLTGGYILKNLMMNDLDPKD